MKTQLFFFAGLRVALFRARKWVRSLFFASRSRPERQEKQP